MTSSNTVIDCDVAIVGAGTAGLTALAQVRKRTQRFVLINDGPLGTTCARVGCMPSKALIEAANVYHRRVVFGEMGIDGGAYAVCATGSSPVRSRSPTISANGSCRAARGSLPRTSCRWVTGASAPIESSSPPAAGPSCPTRGGR